MRGWYYKIIDKLNDTESEVHGPFTQEEMEAWNIGKYFDENE